MPLVVSKADARVSVKRRQRCRPLGELCPQWRWQTCAMNYNSTSPPSDNEITHQLLRTIAERQLEIDRHLKASGWPVFLIVLLLAYIAYKLHG